MIKDHLVFLGSSSHSSFKKSNRKNFKKAFMDILMSEATSALLTGLCEGL